jgi:hypothetical protein
MWMGCSPRSPKSQCLRRAYLRLDQRHTPQSSGQAVPQPALPTTWPRRRRPIANRVAGCSASPLRRRTTEHPSPRYCGAALRDAAETSWMPTAAVRLGRRGQRARRSCGSRRGTAGCCLACCWKSPKARIRVWVTGGGEVPPRSRRTGAARCGHASRPGRNAFNNVAVEHILRNDGVGGSNPSLRHHQ